ncbi:hypothetical protein W97_01727 [Coniosporium apollinis CBS 100218]|uniref:Uncharacterized protein n=1 Tax=Coniosporium apollinis (strain CBS 100218) TaxID=1168221 RepID=R7YL08_CONA1|nr:uncharacterized protein W97_01727 [Coniosporium apollinis CBS 100218]EON62504.1 hypothetical protein W97_01727 [Coniosporium apollinis CBS 100218]
MSTNKSNKPTNNGRPLMPALASTRTAKTPVTPKLAVSTTPASTTRRPTKPDIEPIPKPALREDMSTPVKAFLSTNITPRSSSRKSHIGSRQSTPSGTPTGTPSDAQPASTPVLDRPRGRGNRGIEFGSGSGYSTAAVRRPKSVVSGVSTCHTAPTVKSPSIAGSRTQSPERENSMFFHTSDPKPQEPSQRPPKPSSTFFYANGDQITPDERPPAPSPPLSAVSRSSRPQSVFFHADGTSETPPLMASSPDSYLAASNPAQYPPSLRPPSPAKDSIHLSYRKGASQVMRPAMHRPSILPPISTPPTHTQSVEGSSSRRSSAGSAAGTFRHGHAKTASISSVDSARSASRTFPSNATTPTATKHASLHTPLHNTWSPSSPTTNAPAPRSRTASLASEPRRQPHATTPTFPPTHPQTQRQPSISLPQSPTKATFAPHGQSGQSLQQLNELAASARRERKVLDLEISNSSLLAINRQLERQVWRQKAELRRWRRLSRRERFSAASGVRNEVGDEEGEGDGEGVVDGASGLLDSDDDSNDSAEGSDDGSDSSLSPSAQAHRDSRHRLKDEKRLRLDLSRHRSLLVDSQKLNQSLKRCLGWTEELLTEGKKALAYRVRVSDVRLGGRILGVGAGDEGESLSVADEEEEELEGISALSGLGGGGGGGGGGLLGVWKPPDRGQGAVGGGAEFEEEGTDKDSGVEMEGSHAASGHEGRRSFVLRESF